MNAQHFSKGIGVIGFPEIRRNLKDKGSPPPEFARDADRTFFLSRIPIHPTWVKA